MQRRHVGRKPHLYVVCRACFVQFKRFDRSDSYSRREVVRDGCRNDRVAPFDTGVFRQIAHRDVARIETVPGDGAVMAVAEDLAAGAERRVEDRNGNRIAVRTACDISHHLAGRRNDGHLGRDIVVEPLVQGDEVLLLVDGVCNDTCRRILVGACKWRGKGVQRMINRLLPIERELIFERDDPFEELPVLCGQREEVLQVVKRSVDTSDQPVGLGENPCLRELRRAGIIADRHRFDNDEKQCHIDAAQKFK